MGPAVGVGAGQAREQFEQTQHAARVFTHFHYRTLKSWSRSRRVIAKAEHLAKGAHIKLSARRILIHFTSACPYQDVFHHAWRNLQHYPLRC